MAGLNTTVHVPDDNGGYTVFGPGDEVPAELLDRIGDHCFEDGKKPAKKTAARKPE
jgi:hypothetical protein